MVKKWPRLIFQSVLKPGSKYLKECLMAQEDRNTFDDGKIYLPVLPAFRMDAFIVGQGKPPLLSVFYQEGLDLDTCFQ